MRSEEFEAGNPENQGLSDHDRSVIDFARTAPTHPGRLAEAIVQNFNYRPTRYFQELNRVIDDPKALEYDPVTVNRVRRVREDGRSKVSERYAALNNGAL